MVVLLLTVSVFTFTLSTKLRALQGKVIWKGADTLRANLKFLDQIADEQEQLQQKWNDHIRFSNEAVVEDHS